MNCKYCKSERIMSVTAKCSDVCSIQYRDMEHNGYVPDHLDLGGGDYIDFDFCLDCGRIQGDFPKEKIDKLY